MNRITAASWSAALGVSLMAGTALAQNDSPNPPTFDGSAPAVEQTPLTAPAEAGATTDQSPSAKWRYRWYEGTWWYWSPANKWYVWAVDHWVAYEDLAGSLQANVDSSGTYASGSSGYHSGYGYPAYGFGGYYPRGYRIPVWLWVYRYRHSPYAGGRDPYAGRLPYAGGNRYRAGYGNYGVRSPGFSGGSGYRGSLRSGGGGARIGGAGMRGGFGGGGVRGGFGGGGRR